MDRRDFLRYALTVAAAAGVAGLPLPIAVPVEDEEAMIQRAAVGLAEAFGRPVDEVLDELARGLERQSAMLLDHVGLRLRLPPITFSGLERAGLPDPEAEARRRREFLDACAETARQSLKAGPPDAS